MSRVNAAVVGLGYWGPNLTRNLQGGDDYNLVALVDSNVNRLEKVGATYPWAQRFTSLAEAIKATKPDLVAIATPVGSHFDLAMTALESGCHVLCEKPLASSVAQGEKMVQTAAKLGRQIFVDHTFTYTGAVRKIRDLYTSGRFGDLFYIDSVRINLGAFQPDVDVVWDLAPHDLSILSFVLGQKIRTLQATGSSHNPRKHADVAYLSLEMESGLTAHLHLSWLSPVKVRRMIFSGTASSLIYDDIEASEKIKIYDAGVTFDTADLEERKKVLVSYRRGDVNAPAIDATEALATEMRQIARALRGEAAQVSTGEDGLSVLRVLEACQRSMAAEGARVRV